MNHFVVRKKGVPGKGIALRSGEGWVLLIKARLGHQSDPKPLLSQQTYKGFYLFKPFHSYSSFVSSLPS